MKTCTYKNCERKYCGKGYCNVHLYRLTAGSDMDAPVIVRKKPTGGKCSIAQCGKKYLAKGYCAMHYTRMRDGIDMTQKPRATNTNTKRNCNYCSKEYSITPHRKDISKYCSLKCSGKSRTGAASGGWRGGITPESLMQREQFRKTTRIAVMERDNYTCRICQTRGGDMHVDHIKRWADYPELRFDIDNCRTLCVSCHYYVTFKRGVSGQIKWGLKRKQLKEIKE